MTPKITDVFVKKSDISEKLSYIVVEKRERQNVVKTILIGLE